jgi:ABC-type transporter Mla subunit MlaD
VHAEKQTDRVIEHIDTQTAQLMGHAEKQTDRLVQHIDTQTAQLMKQAELQTGLLIQESQAQTEQLMKHSEIQADRIIHELGNQIERSVQPIREDFTAIRGDLGDFRFRMKFLIGGVWAVAASIIANILFQILTK